MTKIWAHYVVKNEAHRYLSESIGSVVEMVDGVFVFDDQSEDDTVELAEGLGATAIVRDDGSSFLENEGQFRSMAFESFVKTMRPEIGDWVVTLDADEVLDCDNLREQLSASRATLAEMDVYEIFDEDEYGWLYRVDGFWDTITAPVAFRYNGKIDIIKQGYACGRVPTDKYDKFHPDGRILHLGYLDEYDRQEKYDRYRRDNSHSQRHVASIMKKPTLERV